MRLQILDMFELCTVYVKEILFSCSEMICYLVKVRYDLIEQTETLQSFLIDIRLGVKLFKVRDGSKHHAH